MENDKWASILFAYKWYDTIYALFNQLFYVVTGEFFNNTNGTFNTIVTIFKSIFWENDELHLNIKKSVFRSVNIASVAGNETISLNLKRV